MATGGQSGDSSASHSAGLSRLWQARLVLVAAVGVFLGFLALGSLSPIQAILGFVVVAGAALLDAGTALRSDRVPAADQGALSQAERTIDAVIAGLPDPVIVLDRDGLVTAFNDKALAVAPALTRGAPVLLALRVPDVVQAIRRTATGGGMSRVEFFERVPADRWSEALVFPILLPVGAPGGSRERVVVTFHDLTPLRRVEEMRADFIANASHELRTPLASLSGFIETLQGPAREDAAARERFLAIMKEQATRMARLIDDLLSLSRIELNEHVPPRGSVDLVGIIRQVADGLQPLARDREVAVKIEAPAGPLAVIGDRDELIRVFENLVENALKYGATGKRVEITVARDTGAADEVCVAVRDHGPGIAPEHLPRLTERFYRVDVSESRAQGGTGLGLSLVKHILTRHHGRLTISSELGRGAIFTVRLPGAPGRTPAETDSRAGS